MTNGAILERLLTVHRECNRHLHYLFQAMITLSNRYPFQAPWLDQQTDEEVRAMDQFIYRYTKLQDAMGGRLFPSILGVLNEPYEDWAMIDRLNRLEKLGFLESAETWRQLREVRNSLAHEYPEEPGVGAAILNNAWKTALTLHQLFTQATTKLKSTLSDDNKALTSEGLPAAIKRKE